MASTGGVFTVNEFSCITVDKSGTVWAGSTLGGLYYYNGATWKKLPNALTEGITFRDIMPSNMDGNNTIWAASIGKDLGLATLGGVFRINPILPLTGGELTYQVTRYGTTTFGGLSSRLATSLAMNNGLIYVGLDRQSTTNEGGVYKMNMSVFTEPSLNSFSKVNSDISAGVSYQALGSRRNETWFARENYVTNSGTPAAGRIFRYNNSGIYNNPPVSANNSTIPFAAVNGAPNVRAIYTDTLTNNTYVGLSSGGGVAVRNADETVWDKAKWTSITSDNSIFPLNASVNPNAITEVFGEIWIGTTQGIFIYDGCGALNNPSSYRLLTTADGLPSNNITDIALDTAESRIWITSPAGVSRAKYPLFIKGSVQDVFLLKEPIKKDMAITLYDSIKMTPIQNNITIRLLENGVPIETIKNPNICGTFEFKKSVDGKTYSVEIEYTNSDGDKIKYEYANVVNHTYLGKILLPGKLISEIKSFKPLMHKREFKIKLVDGLFWYEPFRGFDVSSYDNAYSEIVSPATVHDNYDNRVNNLAKFYLSASAVYNMGGNYTDILNETVSIAIDFLKDIWTFCKADRNIYKLNVDEAISEYNSASQELAIKQVLNSFVLILEKVKDYSNLTPEQKTTMEQIISIVKSSGDIAIGFLDKNKISSVKDLAMEVGKNYASSELAGILYWKLYCGNTHENFVDQAAQLARSSTYSSPYSSSFSKLSVLQQSANNHTTFSKQAIDASKIASYWLDVGSEITKLAALSSLATVVFAELAPGLLRLSDLLNKVKVGSLGAGFLAGVNGAYQVADISSNTIGQLGSYKIKVNPNRSINKTLPKLSILSLIASKDNYKLKLFDLKNTYNAPYDSSTYFNKFNAAGKADSAYFSELTKTLNSIWSTTDSAIALIPGFSNKLNVLIDSFVSPKATLQQSFNYRNLAYVFDPSKSAYVIRLNNQADSIALLIDSTVAGLSRLIDSVATYGIVSPAYLVQSGFDLIHSHVIGEPGTVSYTLTNYGGQSQLNVSFKIDHPTAGYNITSSDSVYVGTINPGESKTISFSFSTPMTDSVSEYHITTHASNGIYSNILGTLFAFDPSKFYTIADGNWSNPTTWSTGIVPSANSIAEISHKIVVDIDASCKSLKNSFYGNITISPGKKLQIMQ